MRRADSAEKHELLFEAWRDSDGFVSYSKVANGIGKLQPTAIGTEPLQARADEFHIQYIAKAASGVLAESERSIDQRYTVSVSSTAVTIFHRASEHGHPAQ